MPQTYLAYPPTQLRITGGSALLNGVEIGLTVEDRAVIGLLASGQLIQEWSRQAIATAPRRSGRLVKSIKPIPKRGLEVQFYGPFQQAGRLPWLTQSWHEWRSVQYTSCRALGRTPEAARFRFPGFGGQALSVVAKVRTALRTGSSSSTRPEKRRFSSPWRSS